MPIKIESHPSGTGIFTLTNPNSASSRGITLPDATTELVGTDTTQTLTNKTIEAPTFTSWEGGSMIRSTSITASGTSVNFLSIPSWVKRITVAVQGISTSGTSNLSLRVGSGSFLNTGYISVATSAGGNANDTTAFLLSNGTAAGDTFHGAVQLTHMGSNIWVESGVLCNAAGSARSSAGSISVGAVLDRIQLTTLGGTDTFDAGIVNIMYEG